MICINCKYEHLEKFCPNCGESGEVAPITLSRILKDGITTISSMDKGILYNIKQLFFNPRNLVKDYIEGKRKIVFNPISYLIVVVTLYLIIESFIESPISNDEKLTGTVYEFGTKAGEFIAGNAKYFWIFSVFWLSLASKLIHKKYNYAEHLAINSLVIGQATIVGICTLVLFKFRMIMNPFVYLFIIWMFYRIHGIKGRLIENTILAIISTFLFVLFTFLILVFIAFIKVRFGL